MRLVTGEQLDDVDAAARWLPFRARFTKDVPYHRVRCFYTFVDSTRTSSQCMLYDLAQGLPSLVRWAWAVHTRHIAEPCPHDLGSLPGRSS